MESNLSNRGRRLLLLWKIRDHHISKERERRTSIYSITQRPVRNMPFTLLGLSRWSIEGVNLSDSGFNKQHSKELTFESSKTKYNLAPESFKNYATDLIKK